MEITSWTESGKALRKLGRLRFGPITHILVKLLRVNTQQAAGMSSFVVCEILENVKIFGSKVRHCDWSNTIQRVSQ